MRIKLVFDEELELFCQPLAGSSDVPPTPAGIRSHGADLHWAALGSNDELLARCSVWWTNTPSLYAHRVGLVGHYAATDAESSSVLLDHALRDLARQGATIAIGPMDGSTWRRYRFVIDRGTESPFLLEPNQPAEWVDYFKHAGFRPLARYFSSLNPEIARSGPNLDAVTARLNKRGIHFRPLDMNHFDDDLRAIHRLSLVAFEKNFLYTPIAEPEFLQMYSAIRPLMRPELTLMAWHEDRLIGFGFAIADALRPKQGLPDDTLIVKTVAVDPAYFGRGIGTVLTDLCQQAGSRLGYRRGILALTYEKNVSLRIASRYGEVMRTYALFSRRLNG